MRKYLHTIYVKKRVHIQNRPRTHATQTKKKKTQLKTWQKTEYVSEECIQMANRHEKMVNITHHQGDVHPNHNQIITSHLKE